MDHTSLRYDGPHALQVQVRMKLAEHKIVEPGVGTKSGKWTNSAPVVLTTRVD